MKFRTSAFYFLRLRNDGSLIKERENSKEVVREEQERAVKLTTIQTKLLNNQHCLTERNSAHPKHCNLRNIKI